MIIDIYPRTERPVCSLYTLEAAAVLLGLMDRLTPVVTRHDCIRNVGLPRQRRCRCSGHPPAGTDEPTFHSVVQLWFGHTP